MVGRTLLILVSYLSLSLHQIDKSKEEKLTPEVIEKLAKV